MSQNRFPLPLSLYHWFLCTNWYSTCLICDICPFSLSLRYHTPITGNLDKNRHSAYIQLYINTLQITKTINTLFPSLQTTILFYVKTAIKYVKPGSFYCLAQYFSCRTSPCYPLLHPDVPALYTRMLRMATWGCLRNYLLVSAK